MNFYKRHIGDMAKACSHLSQGQQGAYDLLLDWLYGNERPLPSSVEDCHRIGRAVSKPERDNVTKVLGEFFTLTAEGYTQKRVGEEIAKANQQAATNRAIAEAREAKRKATNDARIVHDTFNDSCTNREPSQTPDTRLDQNQAGAVPAPTFEGHSPEAIAAASGNAVALVAASTKLRAAGCPDASARHPVLTKALADGLAVEELLDVLATHPGKPLKYLDSAARGRRQDAATAGPLAGRKPEPVCNPHGVSPQKPETAADRAAAKAAFEASLREFGVAP